MRKRFPLVNKMVLKNLDNQSLARSKEASWELAIFLENKRFYWQAKLVLEKVPTAAADLVRQLKRFLKKVYQPKRCIEMLKFQLSLDKVDCI